MADAEDTNLSVRFEADENTPLPLTIGLGLQLAALAIAGIVLTPAIVVRAAGESAEYLGWAVFAAVVISGFTTILQARRLGRIGAGYVLMMGTAGAFIAVSITALAKGGPAMLATLVFISALFQYILSARLSFFRKVFTPVVTGTVIMLITVSVAPIIFGMLYEIPESASGSASAVTALVTFGAIAGIALAGRGVLRLWAPVIGVVLGSITAAFYGLYDYQLILDADWIGLPALSGWPGIDLSFNGVFWSLLPGFIFVTVIGAIETIGDSVAIQRVSWRKPRAIDYRAVQGAVAADGTGNLLSGLLGTLPNTTYSTSISVTELTGVATRNIGIAIGVAFIVFAFFPKALGVILAIPGPVACAYIMVLLAMLFVVGMKIVVGEGLDYRKGIVAGVAFWFGAGCQFDLIFPSFIETFAGGLLDNGMTTGGLVAMVLQGFMQLTEPRKQRLETTCSMEALPEIQTFFSEFVDAKGIDSSMVSRLQGVVEEILLTFLGTEENSEYETRKLKIVATTEQGDVLLEIVASIGDTNLEDEIALLGEQTADTVHQSDFSIRMLSHLASSIKHQKYHNTDVITARVKPSTTT